MTALVAETWALWLDGVRPRHIARRLGVPVTTVYARIRVAREQGDARAEIKEHDEQLPRCKCGLLLPCNNCPTLDDYASAGRRE